MPSCSVCPSVTFVDHMKTNKRIFKFVPPSGRRAILVFLYQMTWHYFDGNPPSRRRRMQGDMKNDDFQPIFDQFSTNFHFIFEMMQDRTIVSMEGE